MFFFSTVFPKFALVFGIFPRFQGWIPARFPAASFPQRFGGPQREVPRVRREDPAEPGGEHLGSQRGAVPWRGAGRVNAVLWGCTMKCGCFATINSL